MSKHDALAMKSGPHETEPTSVRLIRHLTADIDAAESLLKRHVASEERRILGLYRALEMAENIAREKGYIE